jgi:hypothetical protein
MYKKQQQSAAEGYGKELPQGKDGGNMTLAEKMKTIPELVVASDRTVNKNRERTDFD